MSILFYDDLAISLAKSIVKGLKSGNKNVKYLFYGSLISIFTGIIFVILGEISQSSKPTFTLIAGSLGAIAAIAIFGIAGYSSFVEETKRNEKIEIIEKRVIDHPDQSIAAWDLARIKLESYLNRNLAHIRWIFILILLAMFVGFGIIIFGIIKIYQSPDSLNPSIVTMASGILIEFIASTFLVIYRSTMNQAREYVNVLERINAVGMSVQILESIGQNNTELKDKTRSELVKELLSLYKLNAV